MATPRVFLSYSHDSEPHREAVLALAQELRAWGIDVLLDRFVPAPAGGWPRWMMDQVEAADFVVLVCTEIYRRRFEGQEVPGTGKGVTFEGLLAIQHLYDASSRNLKFIPVVLDNAAETLIPRVLRPYTRYALPGQFEALYRHITGQPEIVAAPLAPLRVLPPRGAVGTPAPVPATMSAVSSPIGPRSPLASGPVRSEGGRDVHTEPAELLHTLLLSLFPSGEFRQWVALGPDGGKLIAELPGESVSPSTGIFRGLEVLRRHGYLDAELFARLAAYFPRRAPDIERVAAAWGARPASSGQPGASSRP